MQWKIPQNENVGALHDTRLQSVWYFVVVLQFVELIDHEAVNICLPWTFDSVVRK